MDPEIITKEWVDVVCPNHGRTSCSDEALQNMYGGWYGFNGLTGEREIKIPRCSRCYLLSQIGSPIASLEFRPEVHVDLEYVPENSVNKYQRKTHSL